MFIVVMPLTRRFVFDDILDLEVLDDSPSGPIIVGITAIQPVKRYMVPIEGLGTVWVNWHIHTL